MSDQEPTRPELTLDMTSPTGLQARRTARALITAAAASDGSFYDVLNAELTGEVDGVYVLSIVWALAHTSAALVGMMSDRDGWLSLLESFSPAEAEQFILRGLAIGDELLAAGKIRTDT